MDHFPPLLLEVREIQINDLTCISWGDVYWHCEYNYSNINILHHDEDDQTMYIRSQSYAIHMVINVEILLKTYKQEMY